MKKISLFCLGFIIAGTVLNAQEKSKKDTLVFKAESIELQTTPNNVKQQQKRAVEVRALSAEYNTARTNLISTKAASRIATFQAEFPDSLYVKKEFRVKKKTGKLSVKMSNVSIEGYDGNEVVFSTRILQEEADEKANGLVLLSGTGAEDNTGLGIHISENGEMIEAKQVSKKNPEEIFILVPRAMTVQYDFNKSVYNNDDLKLKNIDSEVEVSMMYGGVQMENVTGPLTVKTIYGTIDVKFGKSVKGPVSLVSVYGNIDISLAQDTKANINFSTEWGQIYASKEFKIDQEKTEDTKDMGEKIKGKINAGGLDLTLKTSYGKIYMRKS